MKETQSKILPKRIEHNTGGKKTLKTAFQIISSSILILSLGMAVFLPFRKIAVGPALAALAAPLPGIPVDDVTRVKTTETSNFNTPNDPTDDSIEYIHTAGTTVSDSFEYEICDGATIPVCVTAEVSITVNTATLAASVDSPQTLSADVINVPIPIFADADDATVVQYSWVNIDVLANDVWGDDGPGTSAIRLGVDCVAGSVAGDCLEPTQGDATVNTGPRSPDPTGLAYMDGHTTADYTDKLLISDGEVDEIFPDNPAAYAGVNLFITNLSGAITPTLDGAGDYYRLTTIIDPPDDYSNEPTGVAYNPANNHLFFTDDNHKEIYELDPGPDGLYNTEDDPAVIIYSTSAIGSEDTSGAAFDPRGNGHLLISDDAGEEIYDIDLGDNGVLGGVGDDAETVTHFDTASINLINPEGVEFNPDNCSLFILSSKTWTHLIAETTIDGNLLRYLDISSIDGGEDATDPSGLAYAPASGDPSESNLYIIARGEDNGANPLENDGKMFEVSFDNNAPPFVDAGQNDWTVLPNSLPLDGTVTDGCSPELVGVTTTWSVVDKPLGADVIFGDDSAIDTTASFSNIGEYVLKLQADDGGAHIISDEVTITVIPIGNEPPTVDAGFDQIITLPNNSAILDGTVTDDGLPDPPALTTEWTKSSGPDEVTFDDASAIDTTASFSTGGVYVLRLTANDGGAPDIYDEVTITVNQAPIVEAGHDQIITLPDSAILDGTVTDDGLPDPPALFTVWSKVSGPDVVTFADANAINTTASFSTAGVYVLRLTANDGSAPDVYDEVTITVSPTPPQNVWLPLILKSPTNP